MAETSANYDVRISGLWNTVHRVTAQDGSGGVLDVRRAGNGMVVAGRYTPTRGEVLLFRRDPGLLRSQFSLWTESKEWLGSSLRWNVFRREILLHTGSKALLLVPTPQLGFGWRLQAPKTGEMARFVVRPLARRARIEVYRKVDFEVVLFAYFLGAQLLFESLLPGPRADSSAELPIPSPPPRPVGSEAAPR